MSRSAFLIFDHTLYLSSVNEPEFQFETPVSVLCEGLAAKFPAQAKAVLRNRIFTNYEPTPFCEGVVKVAAKRLSVLSELEFQAQLSTNGSIERIEPISTPPAAERNNSRPSLQSSDEIKTLLHQLRGDSSGLKVGAALLSPDQKVLSCASNQTETNPLWHAEYLSIKRYIEMSKAKVAKGSHLYVSLQPCAMCAGYLHHVSENFSQTHIHYLEKDPGPKAQNSVLAEGSDLWKKAGRPAASIHQI